MTEIELRPEDSKYFNNLSKVADLTMQGSSVTQIMREIKMPRKDVLALQEQWRLSMIHEHEAKDRALDALNIMDEHYNRLIKQSYSALEQMEDDLQSNGTTPQRMQQKLNAIKLVADLEAKRLDALQKAGLLDAAEMGDHVAQMEEKVGIMVSILRNDLCPVCKKNVAQKLQQVTQQVEAVVVYE